MRMLVLAAAGLVLVGCATPTTMAPTVTAQQSADEAQKEYDYLFHARWAELERVETVTYRLEVANVDLCPQKLGRLGLGFGTAADYKAPLQAAAIRALQLGDGLTVTHLEPGGPAMAAGAQTGDRIVALDGAPVPTGPKAKEKFGELLRDEIAKAAGQPVRLQVQRGADKVDLAITPVLTCAYDVAVIDSDDINAYADGKDIFVTRPLLKLATSDKELALVIGHELAHDARGHIAAKQKNAAMAGAGGAALDILAAVGGVNTQGAFTKAAIQAGRNFSSPEFEAEADYVGLYFVARAGFDTTDAEGFWRKMAAENPKAILIKTSHPPTAERYVALAEARQEIDAKRQGGQPLVPNEKPKK